MRIHTISIEEYCKNPCRTSSIPFWKLCFIDASLAPVIIHDSDIKKLDVSEFTDQTYFRLIHKLSIIGEPNLKSPYRFSSVVLNSDIRKIVKLINQSYPDIKVNESQVKSWTKTPAYHKDLWVFIVEEKSSLPVALGIADYDPHCREGSLEWIQVLPAYRGMGLGKQLVNELLKRLKVIADFVTVSGRTDPIDPELLYRKCGFEGNDIWHILKRN